MVTDAGDYLVELTQCLNGVTGSEFKTELIKNSIVQSGNINVLHKDNSFQNTSFEKTYVHRAIISGVLAGEYIGFKRTVVNCGNINGLLTCIKIS